MITPKAKDIFSKYSDLNKVYMFNEGLISNRKKELDLIEQYSSKPIRDTDYFNAGVILFSKKSSFLNHIDKNALIYFFNQSNFFEQTYMNYLYRRDALNFFSIDQSFNCMSVKKNSNRFMADFIHYAGNGYCPKKQRPILILKDYCFLYRYQISLKERIDFIFQYTRMRILKVINKLTLFRGY